MVNDGVSLGGEFLKLSDSKMIGFIPSSNLDKAKIFYSDKLGLQLLVHNEFALEYRISDSILRITKVTEAISADYTIFGWQVDDISGSVKAFTNSGIDFLHFDGMDQDSLGICVFPGGSKVAWFKDPDGSTLSLTQFT